MVIRIMRNHQEEEQHGEENQSVMSLRIIFESAIVLLCRINERIIVAEQEI